MVDIALIGAGGIARRHVEALAGVEAAHTVAVTDAIQAKADQLAATCGATAYPSLDACLAHVDLAYILTPPTTHRELAMQAIQAGKPIHFWSQRLGIGVGSGPNWRITPGLLCGMSIESLSHDYERIDVLNDKLDVQSYRDESRHFLDGIQNNLEPAITGEDGLIALRISHAILASHRERRVVTVGE